MPTHGAARVADFEELVREKTPESLVDYYATGAGDEQTLKDSLKAFQRFRLKPRVLWSKGNIDMTTKLQGQTVSFPLGISPTGFQCAAHPEGEKATAKAAERTEIIMIVSSWAMIPLEAPPAAAPNARLWMQVYPFRDRRNTVDMIRRAERSGYKAIVVTVDSPQIGLFTRSWRSGRQINQQLRELKIRGLVNLQGAKDDVARAKASGDEFLFTYGREQTESMATWADIAWIKSITKLPIILKGIMTAESAREAVAAGVQGIIVSAHGGRQLDGIQAPIEALPEVVDSVRGSRLEVYLDGGVRSGRDIFKALAIGAKAVFIGRPVIWGLLHNGEDGIVEILNMLKNEFRNTMSLCGCTGVKDISRAYIRHESQLTCKL